MLDPKQGDPLGQVSKASQSGAGLQKGSSTEGDISLSRILPHESPRVVLLIRVEVSPTTNNCDIEIDGVYKGSTPAWIELAQGTIVTIKLTKPGYLAWEKKVEITPGTRINPELEKEPT